MTQTDVFRQTYTGIIVETMRLCDFTVRSHEPMTLGTNGLIACILPPSWPRPDPQPHANGGRGQVRGGKGPSIKDVRTDGGGIWSNADTCGQGGVKDLADVRKIAIF